jgi:hypothetical protein
MDILGTSALLEYVYLALAIAVVSFSFIWSKKGATLTKKLYAWGIGGIIFNLFSFSFIYSAYPLIWLPKDHQLEYIAIVHILMSVVAGISFVFVGVVHHIAEKKMRSCWMPLLISGGAVCADILRSLFLATLFYTRGKSVIELSWSSATFGNALSVTPFIEYAYLGGVYALTFILFYLVVMCLTQKSKMLALHTFASIILLVLLHIYAPTKHVSIPITIAIASIASVSSTEPTSDQFFINQKNMILEKLSSASSSSVLVVPEDARFLSHLTDVDVQRLQGSPLTTIIDGDTIVHQGTFANYSYVYDVKSGVTLGRGKWFMFPFSEYLPSFITPLMKHLLHRDDFDTYVRLRSYSQGKRPEVFATPFGNVGTLLCSEMLSYAATQTLIEKKVSLIVVQSRLPVFNRNLWFIAQYRGVNKIIAAQSRTPVVVSAYDAPSMVINQYGRITAIHAPENGLMVTTIPAQ